MNTVVESINAHWGCEVIRLSHNGIPIIRSLLWEFLRPNLNGNMIVRMLLDNNNNICVKCLYTGTPEQCITLEIGYTNELRIFHIPYV